MLIGLMSLPNQNSYIQFHPVVYTAKLNIEMSSEFYQSCLCCQIHIYMRYKSLLQSEDVFMYVEVLKDSAAEAYKVTNADIINIVASLILRLAKNHRNDIEFGTYFEAGC